MEIPLDTTFKYLNGEPMIAKFGSDVIKFFIRSEEKDTNGRRDSDILDLFSEKERIGSPFLITRRMRLWIC